MSATPEEVAFKPTIFTLGIALFVFSVIEFGIGGRTYEYVSNGHAAIGGWWCALPAILASFLAIMPSKATMFPLVFLSFSTVLIAGAAVIIDGQAVNEIGHLTSCVSRALTYPTGNGVVQATAAGSSFYGPSSYYYNDAAQCQYDMWQTKDNNCYCVNEKNGCYGYDSSWINNCDDVLGYYLHMLGASVAFDCLILFVSLVLFFVATVSYSKKSEDAPLPAPTTAK